MGKSGGGSTQTVQKADPWVGIQPYLTGTPKDSPTGFNDIRFGQQNTLPPALQKYVSQRSGGGGAAPGTPGLYPEAARMYQQGGWNDILQGHNDQYVQSLADRSGQPGQYYDTADTALAGGFDPNITPVQAIAGTGGVNPALIQGTGRVLAAQSAGAPQVNAATWSSPALVDRSAGRSDYVGDVTSRGAWGGLGPADPTGALSRLLSGQADTSALNNYMNSAFGRMRDNFQEAVMPSIGRGAVASGQYGGSRQGIAEGLAAKGLSQSMGDLAANMYNNAYNTAQSNMYGTANALSSLGLSNEQQNAGREQTNNQFNAGNSLQSGLFNAGILNNQGQFNANALNNMGQFNASNALANNQFNTGALNNMGQFNANADLNTQQFNAGALNNLGMYNNTNALNTQQFNANLAGQNNAQEMGRAGMAFNNRQQGLNMLTGGNSIADYNYGQLFSALRQPVDTGWQNLGNYSGILSPSLGVGGTATSSKTGGGSGSSPVGSALGGAAVGMGIGGPWGAAIGAGLGLLGSL